MSFPVRGISWLNAVDKDMNDGAVKPYFFSRDIHNSSHLEAIIEDAKDMADDIFSVARDIKNTPDASRDSDFFMASVKRFIPAMARMTEIFSFLSLLHNNYDSPAIKQAYKDFTAIRHDLNFDIYGDKVLFKAFEDGFAVAQKQGHISEEIARVYDDLRGNFLYNGVELSDDKQQQLKALRGEISDLRSQFNQHLVEARSHVYLHETDMSLIADLPKKTRQQLIDKAHAHGYQEGFCVPPEKRVIETILTHAKDRGFRQKTWELLKQATTSGAYNNMPVVQKLVGLRHEEAALLGYQTYAEMMLHGAMVQTPQKAKAFLDKLETTGLRAQAQTEIKRLVDFAKAVDGIDDFAPWDLDFYEKTYKKQHKSPTKKAEKDEPQAAFFARLFSHTKTLYGLDFENVTDAFQEGDDNTPIYRVRDGDNVIVGYVLCDLYERPGKRPGANQIAIRRKVSGDDGGETEPAVIVLTANLPQTAKKKLKPSHVKTLSHEMGHVVHNLVSKTHFQTVAGSSVARDFVELPSQLNEKWLVPATPEDAVLPAFSQMQRVLKARLDLELYTHPQPETLCLTNFEQELTERAIGVDIAPDFSLSAGVLGQFYHVFGTSDYSARYYGYLWSDVLAEDAFGAFLETGNLYDADATERLNTMLAHGGAKDYADNYRAFRGRDVKGDAFMRKITP